MTELQLLFDAPILAGQLLIDGLLVGAIFCIVAYGMALVWGVTNIINIAQGEFVMLGGYVTLYAVQAGVPPMLCPPLAALALYAAGLGLYRAVIWRVVDKDLFISILATFGISIFIQQLANELFTANVQTVRSGLESWFLFDGLIVVSQVKVVAFFTAVVLGVVLYAFLRHARLGQAIRATAQNARAARILGVDTDRVYAMTFALNAALCGAAGALVVMAWLVHPYVGLPYTVRSFMIVVVAGIGNLPAVVAAGMGLGVAENFAGFLLGAEYQMAFVFLLLVAILLWRSYRLARRREYLR